jgi:hypothetical protein
LIGAKRGALVLVAGLALGAGMPAALRAAEPTENEAKVGAWILGGKLSLAAQSYFRHTGNPDQFFNDAHGMGEDLGIDVKAFPERPTDSSQGLIVLLDYFGKGDGARIRTDIQRKYGAYHATLYHVASSLFLMPLFNDLDPALGDKLARSITSDCRTIRLPDRLWKGATDAVASRAKFEDVRSAAVQTYQDVLQYLIKVARGEEQ